MSQPSTPPRTDSIHSPHYEGIKYYDRFARVHLTGEVTWDSISTLVDSIDTALDHFRIETVELVIASDGGDVSALNYYIDALDRWRDHADLRSGGDKQGVLRTRVSTGSAASAAAVMLSLGDKRYVDRHASLLYHHGRGRLPHGEGLTSQRAYQISKELKHIDNRIAERLAGRAFESHEKERELTKEVQNSSSLYERWISKEEEFEKYWEYYRDNESEERALKCLLGELSDFHELSDKESSKKKIEIKELFERLNEKVKEALENEKTVALEEFKKLYNRLASQELWISPYIALTLRLIDHIGAVPDAKKKPVPEEKSFVVKEWRALWPDGHFPLMYLKRHILIFGQTGSGKTVSGILPVVNGIIASGPEKVGAALIIDPKKEIYNAFKGTKKIEKFDPSKSFLNMMQFDWDLGKDIKRGKWKTVAEKIVKRAASLDKNSPAKILFGESVDNANAAFFMRQGSDFAISIIALMLMLLDQNAPTNRKEGRKWAEGNERVEKWVQSLFVRIKRGGNIFALLNWALTSELVLVDHDEMDRMKSMPLFADIAKLRRELGMLTFEAEDLLNRLTDYWPSAFKGRGQYSGTLSEALNVCIPFVEDVVEECLFFGCEPSYFRSDLRPGRKLRDFKHDVAVREEKGIWKPEAGSQSLVLYQPKKGRGAEALIATSLKALFFESVLSDPDREEGEEKLPLAAYVADEFQRFATSDEVHGEQSYLDTCRSFNAFCVLACQTEASLRFVFSVNSKNRDQSRSSLDILRTNTGTQFFFRTGDQDTIKLLRELSPSRPGLELPTVVNPPNVLVEGECYVSLPDGRFERNRLEPFGAGSENVEEDESNE